MSKKNKQPFIISRSSSKSSIGGLDRSLSNSMDDLNNPGAFSLMNPALQDRNKILLTQTSFKNVFVLSQTDPRQLQELLDKYNSANLRYRDEEFTQQSELFITKIASDKSIPKEFKAKFPLFQILIAVAKIFMLNEYEIVVFACVLENLPWKIEEVVYNDEHNYLIEFPSNSGLELNSEAKKFIMYLLVVTFSMKQYLNDKSDIDLIQAYCEKICTNFTTLFSRWAKANGSNRFNYLAPEISKKYKTLSQRDYTDPLNSTKDYNIVVDNIMTLTGSYNSKNKGGNSPTNEPVYINHTQRPLINNHFVPEFKSDDLDPLPLISRGPSIFMSDFKPDPSVIFQNLPLEKRHSTLELDDSLKKKLKHEDSLPQFQRNESRGFQLTKPRENNDEPLIPGIPGLSRQNSNLSTGSDFGDGFRKTKSNFFQ